ncbi:MAG: hypothetical protein NTX15_03595 [Candidatus Kapabacteria bacterium]|nr:hypothetical protein [Candidatus Kapabacteria bacterium]
MKVLAAMLLSVLVGGGCTTTTGPDGPTGMVLNTFNYSVGDRAVYIMTSEAPSQSVRHDSIVVKTITGTSGAQTITFSGGLLPFRIAGINMEGSKDNKWFPILRVGSKAGDTLAVFYDTLRSGVLDTISQIYTNRIVVGNPDTTITLAIGVMRVGTMIITSTPSNDAGVGPVITIDEAAVAPQYGVVRSHTRVWAGKVPTGAPFVEQKSELLQIIR